MKFKTGEKYLVLWNDTYSRSGWWKDDEIK